MSHEIEFLPSPENKLRKIAGALSSIFCVLSRAIVLSIKYNYIFLVYILVALIQDRQEIKK